MPFRLDGRLLAASILLSAGTLFAQAPQILSRAPSPLTMNSATTVVISVQFDQAMDATTLSAATFFVYGERTGFHAGAYGYDAGSQTSTFTTTAPFEQGEEVSVILTQGVTNATGVALASSMQWRFHIASGAGTATFTLDSTYASGKAPHAIGVGDLDEDTDMDVLLANSKDDNADVWSNAGTGVFSRAATVSAGNTPRSLALGDFDADGDMDAAIGNETSLTVSVFRNDGTGVLTPVGNLATGTQPVWVTAGEVDGDGFLDLVAVNFGANSFSLFINNGDGTFKSKVDYAIGTTPESAFLGDFDNDGDLDIVSTSTTDNRVMLMTNNGGGVFGSAQTFNTGLSPREVFGADFDGDGRLDIATGNRDGNSISVLLNTGGAFSAASDFPVQTDPFAITAADLDGDQDADIAVVNRLSGTVSILTNDGTANWDSTSYATGLQPRAVNTGDFDGDGALDVVVANRNSDTFQIYSNTAVLNALPGAPQLTAPAANSHTNPGAGQVALNWNVPADSDGDALHFLVELSQVADFSSTVLSADSRTGTAGFSPAPPLPQGSGSGSYTISSALADGKYYWRVKAHDGTAFGPAASAAFTIDTTTPNITGTSLTNPAPGFLPNWYNQNSVASVDFETQYDEAHADSAVFSLGALGGTTTVTGLTNGAGQTVTTTLSLASVADGVYPLSVTLYDSAGNSASDNSASIALDGTPPTGTLASSPPNSKTLDFSVIWGGGSDGPGAVSGLSGNYDVQVQVDGGAWTPWLTNFNGTSSIYTGQQGKTYAFEAAARDNVGNIETFQNTEETSTAVDTTLDATPPDSPVNLTAGGANPSPWQNTAAFAVSWQNPSDASGIARALYKLGTAPTTDFDTTGSASGTPSFMVSATAENGQMLFVWLQDNAGNLDFNNRSVVELRYDATPPTGTLASSPPTSRTLTFTVTWGGGSDTGSGLSGVYDVRVLGDADSLWLKDFRGQSAQFTGEQGNTYGFEAAAHDSVDNIEMLRLVSESTTRVDTVANDVTAPGPPLILLAEGSNPSPWKNQPDFLVSWQPPTDPSGIGRAFFKAGSPPAANFDTTGSVGSGSSVRVTATREGGEGVYVWFEDQRGNIDFNNYGVVLVRFDQTPPQDLGLSFPDAQFQPNWFNPNLSAVARSVVEYTELHARTVELHSATLDTNISRSGPSGTNASVAFDLNVAGLPDALYRVLFTVTDSAGNAASDSADLALDGTPPVGTVASSVDTSGSSTFSVSWDGTGNDGSGSGLSGLYDTRVRVNGGAWNDWLTNFNGTSSDYAGEHGSSYAFEVVAHDNVGNVETIRNIAETTTVVDTSFADSEPPTILHTPPLVVDEGQDATIETDVQDNARVLSVKLFYRRSTSSSFQSMPMLSSGGSTYSATVAASQIGTAGLNYYIEATDGVNISHHPASGWTTLPNNLSVRIRGLGDQGIARSDALPTGTTAAGYRMISVPLNLEKTDPLSVLEDDLGKYGSRKWRLYQYNTATDSYDEYPKVDNFSPGKAYWLIVKASEKRVDSGVGSSVPTNQPFEITLKQGWNDIGFPFTFPVSIANIEVVAGNPNDVVGPYEFSGQWAFPSQVASLKPWHGYSFLSRSAGVKIAIRPASPGSGTSREVALRKLSGGAAPEWALGIQAYCGGLVDEYNQVGVAEDALPAWDSHDYPEPPYISDYVSVRFHHPDWNDFSDVYKTDFRPQFSNGQVWNFEVATTLPNEKVTLKFPGLGSLPGNFRAVLFDRETLQEWDLGHLTRYEFTPDKATLSRTFDLVVGTEAFIRDSKIAEDFIPKAFSLSPNFPNPFNAGTTLLYKVPEKAHVSIRVFNLLGQHVRTLLEDERSPGAFRVIWDGRGDSGLEVGSGVYFIRFQAGAFHQIRKALYIR